jgi:hypothetical protein
MSSFHFQKKDLRSGSVRSIPETEHQSGDTYMFEQGQPPVLSPTVLRDLKAHLHGELICPNDRGYDASRKVWNGMIDKYPALIVRCADVVDVITTIQFARDHH